MRNLLLFFALLFSLPTWADSAIIANCSEGKGCTFELSDIESGVFDPDFDRPVEPDDIIVFGRKKDGTYIRYLSKTSRETIDREWGGDGFTQLGLFNPQIQPKDGLWKATYGTSTGNECYGIGNIGDFIQGKLTPGTAGSGNIYFQHPFNPRQLFPSGQMKWTKTGYNTYKGIMDLGSSAISGMKMHYLITLVDDQTISSEYTIEVRVPTKSPCIGKVGVTFTLLKGRERKEDPSKGVDPEETGDDLLEVKPKGDQDDLLPVRPKDDLLEVKPGQKSKTKVERLDQPKVERIKD